MEYSIVIPHLNMAETVEQALDSLLIQINKNFEIVVIDDGSTDGSLKILERLSQENECIKLHVESNDGIADAINSGIRHSDGEYILTHIDADNYILPVLPDFSEFCKKINESNEEDLHIVGQGAEFAPVSLYKKYPYRSLGYGEDKDRWRRLLADGKLLWFDHKPFSYSIGYNRTIVQQLRVEYETSVTNFRSGISFLGNAKFYLNNIWSKGSLLHLIISPITITHAHFLGRYDCPPMFENKEKMNEEINNIRKQFDEICVKYGINKDGMSITDISRRYLCEYDGHDAPLR